MSLAVAPYVNVGDVLNGEIPAGPATAGLVALDGYSITWGRGTVLEQPTPATAQLRILDRQPGFPFAARTDLVGLPLLLGYKTAPSLLTYHFRGRITDVDIQPHPVGGFAVTLQATSAEIDLANVTVAKGLSPWPAESATVRLGRLTSLMSGLGLLRSTFPALLPTAADAGIDRADPTKDLPDYTVAPATPGGVDMLTLFRELYASTSALPMVYNPDQLQLTFPPRRIYGFNPVGNAFSAQLVTNAARGGKYAIEAIGGIGLDAGATLLGPGLLVQPLDSKVTRVEVTYLNAAATTAYSQATAATSVSGVSEATNGRRTLSVSSIQTSTSIAQQLALNYADLAASEAAGRRLDGISYRSELNGGGFDSAAAADALLSGYERGTRIFLQRSWLPQLGARPMTTIVGGRIAYAGGQWSLDLTPSRVTVSAPWAPASIPSYFARSTVKAASLDASVTFADAAFVDVGAGYTTSTQPPWGGNAT